MGTFQMSILLGFNNSTTLSIKELQECTQLPEKELIKQVQSLLESKLLLVKNQNSNATASPTTATSDPSAQPQIVSSFQKKLKFFFEKYLKILKRSYHKFVYFLC